MSPHSGSLGGRLASAARALALLLPAAAGAAVGPWAENDQARARLVSPWEAAPTAADEVELGVEFQLAPGWHVYWKNSGDAGFPPRVDPLSDGIRGLELRFPAPERFELPGELQSYGYAGEVIYPLTARLGRRAADRLDLAVEIDYLVCEIDCIPYRARLELAQPLADPPRPDEETARRLERWRRRVPVPAAEAAGLAVDASLASGARGPESLEVRFRGDGLAAGEADLFFAVHDLFDPRRPALERRDGELRFHVPLQRRDRSRPLPGATAFDWTLVRRTAERGVEAVEGRVDLRLGGAAAGRAGAVGGAPAGGPDGATVQRLAAALGAGLLSDLVPAVLALWMLTAIQWRREARFAGMGRLRAAVWTLAGIGGALAALAVAGRLAAGAGLEVAWGFHLQRPRLVAALAVAVALAALRLWLPAPALPGRGRAAVGRLLAGRGALAVLFSLVWMPPLLGEARRAGEAPALALFGLGLALPFLALLARPPRTGGRSDRAAPGPAGRQALGFLAATTLIWLFYLLAGLIPPPRLAGVQLGLLGMAVAAFLLPGAGRRLRVMLALLLAAAGVATLWVAG